MSPKWFVGRVVGCIVGLCAISTWGWGAEPLAPKDPKVAEAATGVPTEESTFTLATYNVQARPVLDEVRAKKHLPLIGSLLNPYDIVGVQELFVHSDLLFGSLSKATEVYFGAMGSGFRLANSGLGVASTFPRLLSDSMHYEHRSEVADWVASKGIVFVRVAMGDDAIDIYDTHMQAGHSRGAQEARAAQGEELVRFVQAHSDGQYPVLLFGDFNMGPHRPGKPVSAYDPCHYASEDDMVQRTRVFSSMAAALQMSDVSDTLYGPVRDHIERVLYRAGARHRLEPIHMEEETSLFVNQQGESLSDSTPLVVQFRRKVQATPALP